MSNLSGNFNDGVNNLQGNLDDFTRGAGNFMSGLISNLEDAGPLLGAMPGMKEQAKRFSASWESGFPGQNGIRYNDTIGYLALMYEGSGMTPEAFGKLWGIAMFVEGAGAPRGTWFGHEFTGNGNKDPFSKLNNHGNREAQRNAFLWYAVLANKEQLTTDQILGFGLMLKHLGPKSRSRLDLASQRHDRAVPGRQFAGDPCQHMKANREFVSTTMDYRIFYDRPEAVVIGGLGGTILYGTVDNAISGLRCGL